MATALQVHAALETLASAGWRITPPVTPRLQLVSVREVAEILGVHVDTARAFAVDLAGTVRLPGGDLRVRVTELEKWLERHPAKPAV